MTGAEVETSQEEEVIWEMVLFQNILYFISFSVTLYLCIADLQEWKDNT